jgi:hypothetical protein
MSLPSDGTSCVGWSAAQHIAEAERLIDQIVEVASFAGNHDSADVQAASDVADAAHEVIPEYAATAQAHAVLAIAKHQVGVVMP